MPLYEYRCRDCGHRFEVLQRLGADGHDLECPRCGAAEPAKQYSTFASQTGASGGYEGGAGCDRPGCGAGSGFG